MADFQGSQHYGTGAISKNAADFSKALMSVASTATENMEKVIRVSIVELYTSLVLKTPVDTGRAKASWTISTTGEAPPSPIKGDYAEGEIADIVVGHVSDFKITIADNTVSIINNLDYMEYLEDGTSQQAPYGMVALSLAEFEAYFNHRLKGLEGFGPA